MPISKTIRVQPHAFDAGHAAAALTFGRTDVGALVTFVGLCRDEAQTLAALELEHYPGMAEAELERIATRGRKPLAAAGPDGDPPLRQNRAGRPHRLCRRDQRPSRRRFRGGRIHHGFFEKPRAVLEEGAPRRRDEAPGSRPRTPTRRRWRGGKTNEVVASERMASRVQARLNGATRLLPLPASGERAGVSGTLALGRNVDEMPFVSRPDAGDARLSSSKKRRTAVFSEK